MSKSTANTPVWVRSLVSLGGFTGIAAIIVAFLSRPPSSPPASPSTPPASTAQPVITVNVSNNVGSNNTTNSHNATGSNNSGATRFTSHSGSGSAQDAAGFIQPRPAGRAAPLLSDYEKYIDPNASRVGGMTNVAIALRGLPGSPAAPLEGAVQRALRDRGFSIVPMFRDQFQKDGMELRLFNGDASLANRLRLKQHCDSVLLGVLRFVGPAQVVDGLYVREAVLDIHAVDPGSGRIVDTLEIREKGGGSSAELSTVNALLRLEEMVEANLSEWSWI